MSQKCLHIFTGFFFGGGTSIFKKGGLRQKKINQTANEQKIPILKSVLFFFPCEKVESCNRA